MARTANHQVMYYKTYSVIYPPNQHNLQLHKLHNTGTNRMTMTKIMMMTTMTIKNMMITLMTNMNWSSNYCHEYLLNVSLKLTQAHISNMGRPRHAPTGRLTPTIDQK